MRFPRLRRRRPPLPADKVGPIILIPLDRHKAIAFLRHLAEEDLVAVLERLLTEIIFRIGIDNLEEWLELLKANVTRDYAVIADSPLYTFGRTTRELDRLDQEDGDGA